MVDFEELGQIKDNVELIGKLVDLALAGNAPKFEFIRSLRGLREAKAVRKALKGVANMFAKLGDGVEREYSVGIFQGEAKLELLKPLYDFRLCQKFYSNELAVAEDMISEYRTYLRSGRWLKAALGFDRSEEELVDFREIPLTLF